MAIPFCLPDQPTNNDAAGSTGTSQATSGVSSAMQSPSALLSPVTDAQFMQAFCEALYRCTQNGLPETPLMSPMMSPNPDTGCGYHAINPTNGNRFYFPQIPRSPMSPNNTNAPVTPVTTRNHPRRVNAQSRVYVPRRVRLSSLGEDDMYEDVIHYCASASDSEEEEIATPIEQVDREDLMLHLRHMEAREQLQMFPGRVPPPKNAVRRKRDQSSSSSSSSSTTAAEERRNNKNINNNIRISMKDAKPEQKSKDSFKWPTVVTVVVIAVGCGILVSR